VLIEKTVVFEIALDLPWLFHGFVDFASGGTGVVDL
jgi:hypothetical protein